ncbi:MAG TPA: GAF domain-containing protein [Candidatus Limnocylindrales bacterium]|nr:GAF domain-containing protein [Candidatus Limnocylindrales bacterium]
MESAELRRLILRHRHVGPMLSVLLAGTDARVTITDMDGEVVLDRQGGTGVGAVEQHPVTVEGRTVGWVHGPRPAASIAAVLSYAASREADKRALAAEALDRYRELSLIYDLSESIGASLDVDEVVDVALHEASRLPTGGVGFVALRDGPDAHRLDGGILGSILEGDAEIVNDVAGDPRASESERGTASLVAAPLNLRGHRIGVIGASSPTRVEYRASDLKAISAIASLAAPAIAQATAHAESIRDR